MQFLPNIPGFIGYASQPFSLSFKAYAFKKKSIPALLFKEVLEFSES